MATANLDPFAISLYILTLHLDRKIIFKEVIVIDGYANIIFNSQKQTNKQKRRYLLEQHCIFPNASASFLYSKMCFLKTAGVLFLEFVQNKMS